MNVSGPGDAPGPRHRSSPRGRVLSRRGRDDEAKAEFAEEQALYPESATFMTRLQGRRMAASKPQDGRDMTSGKDNAAGGHAR